MWFTPSNELKRVNLYYTDAAADRARLPGILEIYNQATWELALPFARLVYTPEQLKKWEIDPPDRSNDPLIVKTGDTSGAPAWLGRVHNLLVAITA